MALHSANLDFEEDEFFVYADFENSLLPNELNDPFSIIKVIGIDDEHPIIEVNGKMFKGKYDLALGTQLFFKSDKESLPPSDPLFEKHAEKMYQLFQKTTKVIKLNRMFVDNDPETTANTTSEDQQPPNDELKLDITYEQALIYVNTFHAPPMIVILVQSSSVNGLAKFGHCKCFCTMTIYQKAHGLIIFQKEPEMENIYRGLKNELINIRELFEEYAKELTSDQDLSDNQQISAEIIFENTANLEELEKSVSLSNLDQCDDVRIDKFNPGIHESNKRRKNLVDIPKKALKLKTVDSILKIRAEQSGHPSKVSIFTKHPLSFKNVIPDSQPDQMNDLKPFQDVVISIRLYNPQKCVDRKALNRRRPVFSEEFQCLGSQYLTELRDKISCLCNKHHFFDISENPLQELPVKTTDPGFFFITDTFYNDTRNPENADYSDVIIQWSKKRPDMRNSNFTKRAMQDTKFMDLTIRLGFPQVYQHHGNCEHTFVFSYVEMLSPHNNLTRANYPLLKSVTNLNPYTCNMCGSREYSYIVTNSQRQLHNPSYLCKQCLLAFHYIDGKKIGTFQAYRTNERTFEDTKVDDSDEYMTEEDNDHKYKSTSMAVQELQDTPADYKIIFEDGVNMDTVEII